jgi:polar amino acid transport system ATP-binding protein/sulfate transport system ATP-binding protein
MNYIRTQDTLLSVEGVSLTFDGRVILRDVNVKVDNLQRVQTTGQIVAFLGPSGIGKSQLLRILAGLQKPTSGDVYLGTERTPVHPGLVGMVAQGYYLYRNRTVLGNLVVAAKRTGCSEDAAKKKAVDMLKQFDLEDKSSMYPCQLSGGQRQRVAIAQQLLCSEHYLLLDEPTTGLDPIAKRKVCDLVSTVANQDDLNTIIMVTHDIPTAVAIADTLWVMGRERDANGDIIPGARIVQSYDLIEMGLTWHQNVRKEPGFARLVEDLQDRFERL